MLGPCTHNSPELSLTPGPQDHGRNLSCRVRLQSTLETLERTIRLNVTYAPRNLTTQVSFKAASVLRIQNTSALSVLGDQTVWLVCKADSNPPAKLSWFLRSPRNATTPSTGKDRLKLRLPEAAEDAEFICNAQNPQGSQNVSLRLSVLSPLQLLGPSCSWEAPGLRCRCSAHARPTPSLWLLLLLLLLSLLCGGLPQEDPGYQLHLQEEVVVVQEGLCTRVSCSFTFPRNFRASPLNVYWFRVGDSIDYGKPVATNNKYKEVKPEAEGRFQLLGNPVDLNCSLGISDARRTDQGSYFFRVEQGVVRYSYKAKRLRVQVTELTEKPDIHVHEPLVSGLPANLTCSLPGACAQTRPEFSWSGEMLGPRTHNSPELSLTPGPQDHGRNLSCRVRLQSTLETLERTIRLNVAYAPQSMAVDVFKHNWTALETRGTNSLSLSVLEGQTLRLLCRAPSNPPAVLSWSRQGTALSSLWPQSTGILEVLHVRAADGGQLTCHARNPLGSSNLSVLLSVQEPPSCSCECGEQQGSWPLVLTLIRGTLMGAGFLLTYGLTWVYYSRCGGARGPRQTPTGF